jgi:tetratricopeptide (TPR) repeat protein
MARRKPPSRRSGFAVVVVVGFGLAMLVGCGSFASRGLNSQGVRFFSQNRHQEAIQKFQQALDNDPTNPDSYYNLAATYHRLGSVNRSQADLSRAEQYYHLCLDHDQNHRECYRGLAVLLVQQDHSEEAFRLLKGWGAQSPARAEPKIELARLLEEFGDRSGAQQSLVDALAVDDKNTQALAALGRLREQTGDRQQALGAYQRSLTYDRFQPEVAARVAALQTAAGSTPLSPAPGAAPSIGAPPGGTQTVTTAPPTLR